MHKRIGTWTLLGLLVVAGCSTTGSQTDSLINATYRDVRELKTSLSANVDQLTKTTADLTQRVENAQTESLRVQALVEESQVKLQQIQQRLDELAANIYRSAGMTPPRPLTTTPTEPPEVVVVPGGSGGVESGALPEVTTPPSAPDTPVAEAPTTSTPSPSADTGQSTALDDFQEAQRAFVAEDYERALELYDAYLKKYPDTEFNRDNAQHWKAESLKGLNRQDEALVEFEKVVANYPQSNKVPLAILRQAEIHAAGGRVQEAIALYEQLVYDYPIAPASAVAKARLEELQGNR